MKKQCKMCGEFKELSEFYKNYLNADNLSRICKNCQSKYYKQWREKNLEKAKDSVRRSQKNLYNKRKLEDEATRNNQ